MKHEKDSTTEQRILEAAEKLFYEKGFAMTHTTDIAKEVGCNQALVHYYFRTKEKLFETFFEGKAKLFMSAFLQAGNDKDSFEEKLKCKIEAHFDILRLNPRLPFLLFNEISTNPKRVETFKVKFGEMPKAVIESIRNELQQEIEKGKIRPVNPTELLLSIISLNAIMFIASPIIKIVTGASDKDYEKMVERRKAENVRIILQSLKPEGAGSPGSAGS